MNGARSTTTGTADVTVNANAPTPLLIDPKRAQVLLSIGERRLWELTNCGAIPSHKIGRSVRYAPAELAAWIAAGCPTESGAGERVRQGVSQ